MSKKYRGKLCAYCASATSDTGDHVIAREFFPVSRRQNLPKVPACATCNNEKSDVERYLTAVLPLGTRLSNAREIFREDVARRLAKNPAIAHEVFAHNYPAFIRKNERVEKHIGFRLDASRYRAFFRYIARGLVTYHWNTPVPQTYYVGANLLTEIGEQSVLPLFLNLRGARVSAKLGAGEFQYEGVRNPSDPLETIWQFSIYGGVPVGGDPNASLEVTNRVWAMTSARDMNDIFD